MIPVYNGEKYLLVCLSNLVLQPQGCPFELIVVNDGSTDNTKSILTKFQNDFADYAIHINWKIRHLEENSGLINALEVGMKESSCEFIARLDCDDICESYRLIKQLKYLKLNKNIHVVGSQASIIYDNTYVEYQYNSESKQPQLYLHNFNSYIAGNIPIHPFLVQWESLFHCPIIHPSVMFRKSIILECGSYQDSSKDDSTCIEDYNLWCRVLNR